jgi:hypothetical protein
LPGPGNCDSDRHVVGAIPKRKAPSDTLNFGAIDIGGIGASYLEALESENIAALCDVDAARRQNNFVMQATTPRPTSRGCVPARAAIPRPTPRRRW